jgi:hypothetical protein
MIILLSTSFSKVFMLSWCVLHAPNTCCDGSFAPLKYLLASLKCPCGKSHSLSSWVLCFVTFVMEDMMLGALQMEQRFEKTMNAASEVWIGDFCHQDFWWRALLYKKKYSLELQRTEWFPKVTFRTPDIVKKKFSMHLKLCYNSLLVEWEKMIVLQ